MPRRPLRILLFVLGAFAMFNGTVWILQGTGIFPVGFMANETPWIYRGAAVDVVGLVLILFALRMRPAI